MNSKILPVVAAGVGSALGSMYLDSRYLLSRDLHQIRAGVTSIFTHRLWEYQNRLHFYFRFKTRAKESPNDIYVSFEGREFTFREAEIASNRLAHWLISEGIEKGDVVCMMLQNHPSFLICMLAISKIGGIPSFINTNLSEDPLLHCIKIANAKLFLFDPVYEPQVATIKDACQELNARLVAYGETTFESELPPLSIAPTLTQSTLARFSTEDTSEELIRDVQSADAAYLIYTSGTTGLPKAAISQHNRVNFAIVMFSKMNGMRKGDRVYCVLPLYHSSGMIVACSVALYAGATIVLGRKFSASRFWNDCVDYKVDVFTYIGEFCRYLLSSPPHPEERNHKVRMIYGNGMRPDVWGRFRERFNIQDICEFYAATEAPTSLFNRNSGEIGQGAIGSRGSLFRLIRKDVQLIQIDAITGEPQRDKNGFCVKTPYDEQGELIVEMVEGPVMFDGYYKNEGDTNKKILTNVFTKGDSYFRSGDLLKLDSDGFYYFGDRLGDTFRWKSENVATTEVAHAFGGYPGIAETNIYGTLVPNHDGRAGMAALVLQEDATINFDDLYQHLRKNLPKYAIPVFIRLLPSMVMTGTFKQQKVVYRNEGIDLTKVPETDPIFWLRGETYIPFTLQDFAKIDVGKVKL